jgi:hypothetical protein
MKTILAGGLLVALSIGAYGDTLYADSGAGVTFLNSGVTNGDFSSAFTAANFLSAQTGTSAFVITPNGAYVASLSSGPGAKWIGTNSTAGTGTGDTALYAISFDIPDAFNSGTLTLYYAVDNEVGDSNAGIYLNGIALPSSTGIGTFNTQYTYTDASVGADLVQGTDWLYIDGVNLGGPAGLIFFADISTVNSGSVPEPASVLLSGAGLIAVGALACQRRKPERTGVHPRHGQASTSRSVC